MKENTKNISKRYNIVIDFEIDGEHTTQTLEDYNTVEEAQKAFEFIRNNSFHLPENYDDIEKDKVIFPYMTDFSIDCSVYENNEHSHFESVPHESFSLKTK